MTTPRYLHPLAFKRYALVTDKRSRLLLVDTCAAGRVHFHEETDFPHEVRPEQMPLSEWVEARRLAVIRVVLEAEIVGNSIRVKR